jgi:pimeloyl-ACP methyl ester carboxylesterase
LRAPNDDWNGFYFDGFYPLFEQLVRQFVVCGGVDPERVVAIGYSHGGYGAFALGPKLPHRFAAVHASASAPTDGESSAVGLHTLRFSFMVGGKDTAYGRRERCEKFAAALAELQGKAPGRYPTAFTLVADNGHTGLPDRDLLAQLVPLVRAPLPATLAWELTDGVVRDHYWLHVGAPARGARVDAALADNRLTIRKPAGLAAAAWFDARLVALDRDVTVVDGDRTSTHRPSPSVRTLCTTLQQRGDATLAASWIVPLP